MGLLTHNYLDDRSLRGLKAYKYKAGGYTWLDDLHNPMWNWVVSTLFPLWLAPNLITLTGTLCLVASHVLLIFYAPHLDGDNAPWWAHFLGFAAILVYVNLDCMDGKQARRTNTSNPLGQLFDHGCDAFCVGIILINVATSVSLPCGVKLTLMMFASMVTWVLAQWEEYHTGLMHYGNGYFGVLEANYALACVQLISAIFGVQAWHQTVGSLLQVSAPISCSPPSACADPASAAGMVVSAVNVFLATSVVDALFYIALVFMLVQVSGQVTRVFAGIGDNHVMDAEERGHKDLGTLPALKHLLIFVIFFGLSFMFLTAPDKGILQCRASLTYVSLAYAIIATQLIISHMAKEPWNPILGPFFGLVIAIFNSRFVVVDPALLVYALIGTLTLFYLHYVINVVDQVCAYLGIRCLVIKKSQD